MSYQAQLVGHAFISYVREDSPNVDQLQHLLQTAGVRVWRDTADLWPGEDWRIKVRQAITSDALVFLVCFSRNSLSRERSYQNEELALAIDQMRLRSPGEPWLIPIRFDDCDIPDINIGGGRSLSSIQRADLFGDRFAESAARLVEAVQRILQRHSGLTSSDAGNSAHGTRPDTGNRSSDERANERTAKKALSSIQPAARHDQALETRDLVQIHAGWALWGKRPASSDDYSVLACSDEPFSRAEFSQILTRFIPGVPSAEARGLSALPWVTISRVSLNEYPYLGITVQTTTDTVDGIGRPIIQSSYFCVPYSDLASAPISYTDLYDATAELLLPSHNEDPIQVTVPRLDPEELAHSISEFGESAVATTASLLAAGPVTIIRAEESTLQERLWFIEAVAALLPYGYRADCTAATWSDNWYHHRIRLAFAEQPTGYAQPVTWREPSENLTKNSVAREYLVDLDRLRRRYPGVHGLSAIIERLARDTEPRRFGQAQPVISNLFPPEMIDAYPEAPETRLSALSGSPQPFADRKLSAPDRPEPAHQTNPHTVRSIDAAGNETDRNEPSSQGSVEGSSHGEDSKPASGRNWFLRQETPVQAAIITGICIVLAAAVTVGFLFANSHSSSSGAVDNLVTLPSTGVDAVAYSSDGKYLAAGNVNGIVCVWETTSWTIADTMTDPDSKGVEAVAFNPANSLLAAGDANGHVYVWANGRTKVLTDPSGAAIHSVAFSQDNNYLAAGDASGMVDVWQTSTWQLVNSMTDPDSAGVNSVAFNPANSLLAAGDANGHVYLWANGRAKVLTDPSGAAIRSVIFTTDDRALIGGDSDGHVYVWQVGTGQVTESLTDPDSRGVESVAFDSSTTTIAAADGNGAVYLWLNKLVGTLHNPTSDGALSVAYSPDDSYLAIASASGNVYVRPTNS